MLISIVSVRMSLSVLGIVLSISGGWVDLKKNFSV